MRWPAALVFTSWAVAATALAAQAPTGTVGLVPHPDPERQERLVAAIEDVLPDGLRLVVGTGPGHWSGATETVRRLLDEDRVDVLLVPAERSLAHLAAQVASRRHVAAIELSLRGSSAATSARSAGTSWLITCGSPLERTADENELETVARLATDAARAVLADPGYQVGRASLIWRTSLPATCRDDGDAPASDPIHTNDVGSPTAPRHRGSSQ